MVTIHTTILNAASDRMTKKLQLTSQCVNSATGDIPSQPPQHKVFQRQNVRLMLNLNQAKFAKPMPVLIATVLIAK